MATMKCWHCKCIIDNEEDLVIAKIKNVNRKFHKGLNCLNEFNHKKELEIKEKEEKKKVNKEWIELYEYVKKEILGYSDNMQLSNNARNHLQQLKNGGIIRNKTIISNDGYPYSVILMTFKVKRMDIERALASKTFESENQKFNYIMAIIKNSINDVYLRVLEKERREQMIKDQVEVTVKPSKKVEYIKKSEINNKSSLFDDIW